jgi:hypothetical protein
MKYGYKTKRTRLQEEAFQQQGERETRQRAAAAKRKRQSEHRAMLSPVRVVALLLALFSVFSVQFSARAGSTLLGNTMDLLGVAVQTNLTLRPDRNSPLNLTIGLVLTQVRTVTNSADGSFAITNIQRGDYILQIGSSTLDRVRVSIPSTNGTYSLQSVISSSIIFPYEYSPDEVGQALGSASDAGFVGVTNNHMIVFNSATDTWTNKPLQIRAGTNVTSVSTNGLADYTINVSGGGGGDTSSLSNQVNAEWQIFDARSFGITGYLATAFGENLNFLPAMDTNFLNLFAAASNAVVTNGKAVKIVLPPGVIRLTNDLVNNVPKSLLVGSGPMERVLINPLSEAPAYTVLWQSNTNASGLIQGASDRGFQWVENLSITGSTNPAGYFTFFQNAPMWIERWVTNNANPFAKVGIYFRGYNDYPTGGRMKNVQVAGFKLGLANACYNFQTENCWFTGNDVGMFQNTEAISSYLIPGTFPALPVDWNSYTALIATNSSVEASMGVPDQATHINTAFGHRVGGVGVLLGRGYSFTMINSVGMPTLRTYAVTTGDARLTVLGGNEEPMTYMGTNWIFVTQNSATFDLRNWRVQGLETGTNVYGEAATNGTFIYAPNGSVNLTERGNSILAYYVGGVVPIVHAQEGGNLDTDQNRIESRNRASVGNIQTYSGKGTQLADPLLQDGTSDYLGGAQWIMSRFPVGTPQYILGSPGYFQAIVSSNGVNLTLDTNQHYFTKFLTSDPISGVDYFGRSKTIPNHYTVDRLTVRSNLNAAAVNAGTITSTNRAVFLDGTTNSGPVTFSAAVNRALLTFGATNTGFGVNGSAPAAFQSGSLGFQVTVSGTTRRFLLGGGFANEQNRIQMSDFGPIIGQEVEQGRLILTNGWSATALTNRLYGIMEFGNITSGSNTFAGGGIIYASNGELRVADAFANHTTFSPHAKDSPGAAIDDGIANPIVFKHENAYLGEVEWLHLSAIARELETLTGKKFVYAITNAPRSWSADQDAAQAAYDAERAAEIIRRNTPVTNVVNGVTNIVTINTNITVRPVRDVKAPEPDRIKRVREDREKKGKGKAR